MRLNVLFLVSMIAALTSLNSMSKAQPGKRAVGSRPGTDGSSSLNRAGLKVGMSMPEIKVFDDKGKEFNTSSLKGSYTVLTFGCLT